MLTLPQMLSFAERLKDMRWHIQLIADAEMLSALEVLAPRMPVLSCSIIWATYRKRWLQTAHPSAR